MSDDAVEVTLTYTRREARLTAHVVRMVDRSLTLSYIDHDRLQLIASAIELASKPPKPDEPTAPGAVVEDSNGEFWVRVEYDVMPWMHKSLSNRDWWRIDAVHVLSEGVTS